MLSELVAHHKTNPNNGKSSLLVKDTSNTHSIRLNGDKAIQYEKMPGKREDVVFTIPLGMMRLDEMIDATNDTPGWPSVAPRTMTLWPGQSATLRFIGGHVIHTIGVLPTQDFDKAPVHALKQIAGATRAALAIAA